MPQISDPKSQEIHRFWAQESTIRLFLKQKGKTPENKELTAVVNLKKKSWKKIWTEWGQGRHVPSLISPIKHNNIRNWNKGIK